MEYHTGVEREQVVAAFEQYFAGLGNLDEFSRSEQQAEQPPGEHSGHSPAGPETGEVGLPDELTDYVTDGKGPVPRALASLFLRRLLYYGWVNEEELADFTRIINISSHAKPFFEALYQLSQGLKVEYESHIVAVYSSLCGDAVAENGHHAVLNAHYHTRLLIESLKVLEQNIKAHIQQLYAAEPEVREILHIHYNIYMNEIVDRAYNRLKTSDNLSKYRPKINVAVRKLLEDEVWLMKTAGKLAVIKHLSVEETRKLLVTMLKEVREDLRSIDPILEEIDDKNRRYSRISTERIKTKLYSSASLQGKIGEIVGAIGEGMIAPGDQADPSSSPNAAQLPHGIFKTGFINPSSLYSRRAAAEQIEGLERPEENEFDLEFAETELKLRIKNQLNPTKIARFLDRYGSSPGVPVPAEEIIEDMESFVKVLYAAAYGDGREAEFPYRVVWGEQEVTRGRFRFKAHSFVKEYSRG
jgi:hypothetical protein